MALLTRGLTVCLPARLAPSRFRARALPLARFSAYASADVPELNSRVYTSYDIFKGKSAMNVKVIAPTFSQSASGGPLTLKKAGALLLECAPGAARAYDWSKKMAMALNVTEMAEILAFTAEAGNLEFLHDPAMGTTSAGQTVKTLRISPMPDGKGLFVNMTQRDKSGNTQLSVPLTWGEFAAMRSLIDFSIPRCLGWDRALAETTIVPQ